MALGPRLDLRQSQSLVMTPQLQQAIKLLQMSNLEVATYLEQEIQQNPLLEREDPDGGITSEGGDAPSDGDDDSGAGTDGFSEDAPEIPDSAEMTNSDTLLESDSAALDTDYGNVWELDPGADSGGEALHWNISGGEGGFSGDDADLESVAASQETLRDHLLRQINVDLPDPADRMIAGHLIETLDEAGYVSGGIDWIAVALGCDVARIEETLKKVQFFDPAGVFARNLSECLALQLRDRNRLDPAIQALLDNLDLLAKRDFEALRRVCRVDADDLSDMIVEIKALNPKPASAFDHVVAQPIVPDVFVRRREDGTWLVELNAEALPRVLVNTRYFATVNKHARSKSEKDYLIDRLNSANWLVKSLHQRAQTILKVATELVNQQEAFFTRGVQYLKPLTLRDVAEVIGVHESTVSRVTNNKYLGFSRGVYEMKFFFTSAIGQNADGENLSAESIRYRIKALIDRETPDGVLSDDKIVDMLRRDGVEIARRTVAKYREAMHIPSSVQRRREKALHV